MRAGHVFKRRWGLRESENLRDGRIVRIFARPNSVSDRVAILNQRLRVGRPGVVRLNADEIRRESVIWRERTWRRDQKSAGRDEFF